MDKGIGKAVGKIKLLLQIEFIACLPRDPCTCLRVADLQGQAD